MPLKIDRDVVCWTKLDGDTLLVHLDSGFYYTLDSLGGFIWELLLEERSKPEIVTQVMNRYAAPDKEVVERDFDDLIAALQREGLIELS